MSCDPTGCIIPCWGVLPWRSGLAHMAPGCCDLSLCQLRQRRGSGWLQGMWKPKESYFEEGSVPHWPLKQGSSLWLQPALDYLRCVIAVGSTMSGAENSGCCFRVKVEFLVILPWAAAPSSPPRGNLRAHLQPLPDCFSSSITQRAFVWFCRLVLSSVNSWRCTERGMDFIWVLCVNSAKINGVLYWDTLTKQHSKLVGWGSVECSRDGAIRVPRALSGARDSWRQMSPWGWVVCVI